MTKNKHVCVLRPIVRDDERQIRRRTGGRLGLASGTGAEKEPSRYDTPGVEEDRVANYAHVTGYVLVWYVAISAWLCVGFS